jgi:hypothetical protein
LKINKKTMKYALLFTCLLLGFIRAEAQFTAPVIIDNTQNNFYSGQPFDWDHDGDLDMVGTVFPWFGWRENTGNGQLAKAVVLDSFYYNVDLPLMVDFNGDNRTDIVFNGNLSQSENALNIRLQLPNGKFGPPVISFNYTDHYKPFALADFDTDGDMDFVRTDDVSLQWYENDGAGNFEPPHFIADPAGDLLTIADVNADGLPDILSTDRATGIINHFQNLGAGNFNTKQLAVTLPDFLETLKIADLDGDGLSDLLPIYLDDDVFTKGQAWLKNNGNGTFNAPQPLDPAATLIHVVKEVVPGDIDQDGDADVLVYAAQDTLAWFENIGAGQFSTHVLAVWPEVQTLSALKLIDFDADGLPDLVTPSGQGTAIFKNKGGGQFAKRLNLLPEITGYFETNTADIDQDNLTDIVAVSSEDGKIVWYPNLGNGQFGDKQVITNTNYNAIFIRTADLDGDGDPDILSGIPKKYNAYEAYEMVWYRNDGAGHFGQAIPVFQNGLYFPISRVELADIDGDGHKDIVCSANIATQSVAWLRNDGAGNFAFPKFITLTGYAGKNFTVTDFDGDLDKDLLVLLENSMNLYANDGSGNFDAPISLGFYGAQYYPVQVADMDDDGDNDIFSDGENWFRNMGNNIFTPGPKIFPPAYGNHFADLNKDGKPDLYGTVDWHPNIGNGVFEEPIALHYYHDPYGFETSTRAVDLDGDGDLEILFLAPNQIGYAGELGGLPYILGHCFLDENENGIRDSAEVDLPGIQVTLNSNQQISYPYTDGKFRFYTAPGQYQVAYLPNPCWTLTTDSAVWNVAFSDRAITGLYFGFKPAPGARELSTFVSAAPALCNGRMEVWLTVQSQGCRPAAGRLALVHSSGMTVVGGDISPDLVSGDTLFWQIDTLLPGTVQKILLFFDLAFILPGTTLHLDAYTETYGDDGVSIALRDTFLYPSIVLCAFDPNDKMVDVKTLTPGYAVEKSELTYTVRFQNTGNYPAANIRIRDTLDAGLDWATLRPIAASHNFYTNVDLVRGVAEFNFPNIFLADSFSNELNSHGFVTFAIFPKAALPEGTVIPNRAGIFFDFNPPVMTNYAETLVKLIVAVHSEKTTEDWVSFFPNPASNVVNLRFKQTTEHARVRVYDMQGRLCLEKQLSAVGNAAVFEVAGLPSAAYMLEIVGENGETGRAVLLVEQ